MKLKTNVRNVLIIAVLAAVVAALKSGQDAANTVIQAVSLGFLAAFVWVVSRLYRENKTELYSLGTKRRTIVYVAAGVAVLTFSAYDGLTSTGFGTLVFLALLAGCGYAGYSVYRSTRQY